MNTDYSTRCLSTSTVKTCLVYHKNKNSTGKTTKLCLVCVVAGFDWLTQISVYKGNAVSLCSHCVDAARMKEEFIGRSHRKDRNGTGHDTRALLAVGHLGWSLVQKCQIWFNADFAKFTYLNRSLNLNKPLSLILFFSKVLFLHYLKQMQWWKEPEEPQTK